MHVQQFFLLMLTSFAAANAQGATLVYVDSQNRTMHALGGDPNPEDPERFTAHRCRLREGAFYFSPLNRSMADFYRDTSAVCAPVNREPLRYNQMPAAVTQARAEVEEFLNNNGFDGLVRKIEEDRRSGKLERWPINPTFDQVYVRFGNTVVQIVINRNGPVKPQLQDALDWLRSDQMARLGENLPDNLRQAQNSPGIYFALNEGQFVMQGDLFMVLIAMADSQRVSGQECRHLIEQVAQLYFSNEDLVELASREQELKSAIFRAGRPLAAAIASIRGNLDPASASQGFTDERCARALQELARELPNMMENINSLMALHDLGQSYQKLLENTAPVRERIRARTDELLVGAGDAR